MRATPEEMAWREYLANSLENERLTRQFETMTNNYRPVAPDTQDFELLWPWAEKNRCWMVAYRRWLTTLYGWQRAPAWLVEETTR